MYKKATVLPYRLQDFEDGPSDDYLSMNPGNTLTRGQRSRSPTPPPGRSYSQQGQGHGNMTYEDYLTMTPGNVQSQGHTGGHSQGHNPSHSTSPGQRTLTPPPSKDDYMAMTPGTPTTRSLTPSPTRHMDRPGTRSQHLVCHCMA